MTGPGVRSLRWMVCTGLVLGATVATAPSAWAAAPSNDNRASAIQLLPPQSVQGTLVEATLEPTNDSSSCGATDGSVWYHFTAPDRGSVVLQLDAAGAMDSTVDIFKRVRSTLTFVDCAGTDSDGKATLEEDGLDSSADYLIRVGNQTGSAADAFRLGVLVPTAPPAPPGHYLPAAGVRNHVDRVLNPADAYWHKMHAGTTMRLNLHTDHCTSLEVYGPGTKSFADEAPEKRLSCGGFGLFTPTTTGRHYLVVRAARDRDVQRYRLKVAPAGRDDTVPGVRIHNHATVKGSVNGGLDTRDLYRFDATRRSALTLTLAGSPTLRLVSDEGAVLAVGSRIDRHVPGGRYYVAVSGSGRYTLRLALRVITSAALLVNGHHSATIEPQSVARLWLRVRPRVSGPSSITVERFDPIEGWQFLRSYAPKVSDGSARVSFHPPSVGRYRMFATYAGSRDAAPSSTGTAHLRVQRPLSP